MKIIDNEGNEIELPMKFEVCDRCQGTGTHVNPAIDGHGIGADEWNNEWDDDERHAYLTGRYDVRCDECHGERVVAVPDLERMSEAEIKLLDEHNQALYEMRATYEAERRMGA